MDYTGCDVIKGEQKKTAAVRRAGGCWALIKCFSVEKGVVFLQIDVT